MGSSPSVARQNKDFQSVVPGGVPHAPYNSTSEGPRKRKFNTNQSESADRKLVPQQNLSATPSTAQSNDTYDRSSSYRSDGEEDFDRRTEGQQRRDGMSDCEFECSQISKYLYLGGQRVAENLELLKEKKITRIINCASAVVPNYHEGYSDIKYLTLNLVDGKVEDISWFTCEVIQFIFEGANDGQKTLLHCEKGISRSCSFAIAYRMWSTGEKWKTSFEYVQKRRKICNPTTAFVCNLIEIGEIFSGSSAEATLLFRCSYHAAYDHNTPVLKLCRNLNSRRILVPATSLLNPKGVYILRAVKGNKHFLFLWRGRHSKDSTVEKSIKLATMMVRIFSNASSITKITDGEETDEFLSFILKDGPFKIPDDNSASYEDFYDFPPSQEQIEATMFSMSNQRENNSSNMLYNLGMRTNSPNIEFTNNNNTTIRSTTMHENNNNNNNNNNHRPTRNGDQTPRSRSASRERGVFNPKPIEYGTVNVAGRDKRPMESEPVSIQLPAQQMSRSNSIRSVANDYDGNNGPSVNSRDLLNRINNIISTAEVNSSRRASPPAALKQPLAVQPNNPQRKTSISTINTNLMSGQTTTTMTTTSFPVVNALAVETALPQTARPLSQQQQQQQQPLLLPLQSVPIAPVNPPHSARSQNIAQQQQQAVSQSSITKTSPAKPQILSLQLSQVQAQSFTTSNANSPTAVLTARSQQIQLQNQLKLPQIINRNGSAGDLHKNSSSGNIAYSHLQSPMAYEYPDTTEVLLTHRSGSKTKIMPLSEVVGVLIPQGGLTPSRPSSAEKKSFVGMSPRVMVLNKPTVQGVKPSSGIVSLNLSVVPPVSALDQQQQISSVREDKLNISNHSNSNNNNNVTAQRKTVGSPVGNRSNLNNPATSDFAKPILYHLSRKKTTDGVINGLSSTDVHEWKAMGVYDDQDLDEVNCVLFFHLFSSVNLFFSFLRRMKCSCYCVQIINIISGSEMRFLSLPMESKSTMIIDPSCPDY
jgi:protein-tyrosine phosphatase